MLSKLFRRGALSICLAGCLSSVAAAHDLEANRVSVVLRDNIHLSLQFRIDYFNFLRQAYAPTANEKQALLELASLSDQAFDVLYQQSQKLFIEQTILNAGADTPLQLSHWRWPKVSHIQQSIRKLSAQMIVSPQEHIHYDFVEVQADAIAMKEVNQCRLKLPSSLGNVLVIHYRAQQQWNEQKETEMRF
ncbi:hypothetical protein RF679_10800 [Undibacterium cyanobacteriorum]|uniref:DUF4390 domain-containing protein n=1 Tax=Undibacterium cyanobacteriorum TaxID=3073561 RepID=A0ABY9RE44_9BURK|nr:hypothetical protein [Undibacterium sp. 20NA77.5]WMW79138.1 hypothetical protein RF679_10800 [Undibacterium sp. 20NA77.5]